MPPPPLAALVGLSRPQVEAALGSRPEGLRHDEVVDRLSRQGPNREVLPRGPSLTRQFAGQFLHFFALLLWGAAVAALLAGMPELSVAIVVVVVVNGLFAFVQEYRADRTAQALLALLPGEAMVRRGGMKAKVPAAELVVGDLVLLREGARIPADARLVEADGLRVDLSLLTGESEPQARTAAPVPVPTEVGDAPNLVFAGSFVSSGAGVALVAATGGATRLSEVSSMATAVRRRPTPLRRELARAVRVLALLAVSVGAVLAAVAVLLGMQLRDGLLFGVGVVVALVPEGLLPTLSLALATSARRIARRQALVRRLEAVETLGAVTVICSDKTGTITANELTARALWCAGDSFQTTGLGFSPQGAVLQGGHPLDPAQREKLRPLLRAAALCGDATVEKQNGRWICVGDPTEGALAVLAAKGGLHRLDEEHLTPRVREFPFDARRRRMSTVQALPGGRFEVLCKGSPESMAEVCRSVPEGFEDQVARFAAEGLRVLALGRRPLAAVPAGAGEAERELELLGLVAMVDPVRPAVPQAMAACRRAGIRVLMVTGDHPRTAQAVATQAGLADTRVVLGRELPADEGELSRLLASGVGVLARVDPEHKLLVARALQASGEVVAMTGDGVNDAPALRQAEIGIAMGRSGTDVAREAADLVLLDDDFSTIVAAVEEGRAAFANIRRFMTYHLTDNVAELAPFAVWALSGGQWPLLLGVLQILALDIGTDLLPAVALGAERPHAALLDRPARSRSEPLLDRLTLLRAFGFLGPLQALFSLAAAPLSAWLLFGPEATVPLLSTVVFSSIVAMQMINALSCRSRTRSVFARRVKANRLLLGAVLFEFVLLLAFVYLPPLARLLGHAPLSATAWLFPVGAALLFLSAEELRKAWVRRRRLSRPQPT